MPTTTTEVDQESFLDATWCACVHGEFKAESEENTPAGVGRHIYIGQYVDPTNLNYLNAS